LKRRDCRLEQADLSRTVVGMDPAFPAGHSEVFRDTMIRKTLIALPLLCTAVAAPSALAGFEVTQAHALASVLIGDGPEVVDEDWDLPLQVCAVAGGPQGIGSSTGASFNLGYGFNGTANAQATSFAPVAVLAAGTLMDFSFVVGGDVTASLSIELLLIANGEAFGAIDLMLQDITEDITLVDLHQTQGSTSMTTAINLIEGHTYQLTAQANAGLMGDGAGSSTASLSFQMLVPAPGVMALLAVCGLAAGRRRRRRD
jgi:hypothetical protein